MNFLNSPEYKKKVVHRHPIDTEIFFPLFFRIPEENPWKKVYGGDLIKEGLKGRFLRVDL